jgi:hypothetical protein
MDAKFLQVGISSREVESFLRALQDAKPSFAGFLHVRPMLGGVCSFLLAPSAWQRSQRLPQFIALRLRQVGLCVFAIDVEQNTGIRKPGRR